MTSDEQECNGTAPESGDLTRHSSLVTHHSLPIGVFDSGVGGLTVLRALRQELPHEEFIYLGDTARLPYGTKSAQSIVRYSLQAADFLVRRGIKYLLIACNTASAAALEDLRARYAPLPVMGVVEPGAEAACAASAAGQIAVIATESTIRGHAYQREIYRRRPEVNVIARACSLFVALAEEGWTSGPIVESVARRYLADLIEPQPSIDTLLLGCTHFPVLADALRAVVSPRVTIVDSAQTAARFLFEDLKARNLFGRAHRSATPTLLATDGAERFARVGSLFLNEEFHAAQVEIVDLMAVESSALNGNAFSY